MSKNREVSGIFVVNPAEPLAEFWSSEAEQERTGTLAQAMNKILLVECANAETVECSDIHKALIESFKISPKVELSCGRGKQLSRHAVGIRLFTQKVGRSAGCDWKLHSAQTAAEAPLTGARKNNSSGLSLTLTNQLLMFV